MGTPARDPVPQGLPRPDLGQAGKVQVLGAGQGETIFVAFQVKESLHKNKSLYCQCPWAVQVHVQKVDALCPQVSPVGKTSGVSVPQPGPVPVESLQGEGVRPGPAEPISTLVLVRLDAPGSVGGVPARGGLARWMAETKAWAVPGAGCQVLSAGVARRPGLGCWMGRGQGRASVRDRPCPHPTPRQAKAAVSSAWLILELESVGASALVGGPSQGGGRGGARSRSRGESGLRARPQTHFCHPARGARFAMQSHPASQHPNLPRNPLAFGASPARGPPPPPSPPPSSAAERREEVLQPRTNKRWSCTGLKKFQENEQ